MNIDLRLGDCLEVLKTIPDNSVDAIVTDPPYGLGFMNKEWDSPEKLRQQIERESQRSIERKSEGKSPTDAPFSKSVPPGLAIKGAKEGKWFQDWCEQWSKECLRILKPGGHMLSFSAPRTYHRMATAVEDAGFEIRDQIVWTFGSGFPKSHNIGKAMDKLNIENNLHHQGTALKPAHEPMVLGQKKGGEELDIEVPFVYNPKASKKDRNEGLDDMEEKIKAGAEFRPNHMKKALEGESGNPFGRWNKIQNNHPTVKPTDLMRYLINLITPPNGTILDPFMGSGSTGKAAVQCGVNFIGIEKEEEYYNIAKARINDMVKKSNNGENR